MISCLCVTRGDRPMHLAEAIGDYARQTFPDRELLILHDGDAACHDSILALAAAHPGETIRVERAAPGPKLGGLRSLAVAWARGDWICQWDDDDRYHPARLRLQWEAATAEGAAAVYLADQLHWFRPEGLLFWDDWNSEPYPMNFVQGTILARKDILPPYQDVAAGEDTLHTCALLREAAARGFVVSRPRGLGWCYIYSYHGGNVWDAAHHRAISAAKHLSPARLLPRVTSLRARLCEYHPALPPLRMQTGRDTVLLP